MKETPGEHFRWSAHTGGVANVKPKDYEAKGEISAGSTYAAWKALSTSSEPLRTGDLLEEVLPDGSPGELHIAKYIGFEKAIWFVPENKPEIPNISTIETTL